jgi:hypothetical protein
MRAREIVQWSLPLVLAAGCAASEELDRSTAALACFHTDSQIACVAPPADGPEADELRTKIEDFYPSACFDGDHDADGVPDFLDLEFLAAHAAGGEDDREGANRALGCPRCNRGPGTAGDFRLRIDGEVGELDRGKVYLAEGDVLTVPTPEGLLRIVVTAETRLEDGAAAPGAEIRVEGTFDLDGALIASRLDVLCAAPGAVPDDEVPEDAEPADPSNEIE